MLKDFDSQRCPDFCPDLNFQACVSFDPAVNPLECGYCKKNDKYYRCIAHNGIIPLSHSMVQNFLTCHHLCYLSSLRGIIVRENMKSPALKMGALWDAVIGKHMGGIDKETGEPYDIPAIIKKFEIGEREIAKVKALFRAYKMFDIQWNKDGVIQKKIDLTLGFGKVWGNGMPVEIYLTGYYDRWYESMFVEMKLTGRPDLYEDVYFIQSQISTYFLADPNLESVVMEITRTPDLKKLKNDPDESVEAFGERVYQDILKRPSHYFIGYDNTKHRYGRRYYRKEFNLDEVKSRYIHIFREYWEARQFDGWYKNDKACGAVLPGIPCEMIPLCRNNNMSETIFKIRQRPITF